MRLSSLPLVVFITISLPVSGDGAVLYVSQMNPHSNYGYGLQNWNDMTNRLNSVFGAENISVHSGPIGDLGSFDALWITLRAIGDPGLSPAEQANVVAFLASGKRAVLVGENSAFLPWNTSILNSVGGTYGGFLAGSIPLTPVVSHPVTAGIQTAFAGDDGFAIGGRALFNQNVVTLWGNGENAITVLSVGMLDNASDGATPGNTLLKQNLAVWLGSPSNPVPEPTSFLLISIGLGLTALRLRK